MLYGGSYVKWPQYLHTKEKSVRNGGEVSQSEWYLHFLQTPQQLLQNPESGELAVAVASTACSSWLHPWLLQSEI